MVVAAVAVAVSASATVFVNSAVAAGMAVISSRFAPHQERGRRGRVGGPVWSGDGIPHGSPRSIGESLACCTRLGCPSCLPGAPASLHHSRELFVCLFVCLLACLTACILCASDASFLVRSRRWRRGQWFPQTRLCPPLGLAKSLVEIRERGRRGVP